MSQTLDVSNGLGGNKTPERRKQNFSTKAINFFVTFIAALLIGGGLYFWQQLLVAPPHAEAAPASYTPFSTK